MNKGTKLYKHPNCTNCTFAQGPHLCKDPSPTAGSESVTVRLRAELEGGQTALYPHRMHFEQALVNLIHSTAGFYVAPLPSPPLPALSLSARDREMSLNGMWVFYGF